MLATDFDLKTAHAYKDLLAKHAREIFPQYDQLSHSDAFRILAELVAVTAASLDRRLSELPEIVIGRIPGILGLKPHLGSPAEAYMQVQIRDEVEEEVIVADRLEVIAELAGMRLGFRSTETGVLFNYGAIHLHHEPGRLSIGFPRIPTSTNISLYFELERPLKKQQIRWTASRLDRSVEISIVDSTYHLGRSGVIKFFTSNMQIDCSSLHGQKAYWIHGAALDRSIEIPVRAVIPNIIKISNQRAYHEYRIGAGSGLPGQRLKIPPGEIASSFRLQIFDGELGKIETWEEVQTLFLSASDSRHFVIDRDQGEIVFGDGVHGRIAPPGYDNIVVEFLVVSDGIAGNIPAATPLRLKRDDWRFEKIKLITDATGGRNCVASGDLVHHMHALFRNRDRAVTLTDFQDLGLDANPRLGRLFVYEKEFGVVQMVAVLKPEYASNPSSLDFTPFATDLEVVEAALARKRILSARVEISAPDYRDFRVRLRAYVRRLTDESRTAIENAVLEFFSPYNTSGTPLQPGGRILQQDLSGVIERLSCIQNIRALAIEDMSSGVSETLIELGKSQLARVQCELNLEEVST